MIRLFMAALATAIVSTGSVNAQNFEMFSPEDHPFVTDFRAAPVVRAGDFVFISGVVGFIPPDQERTPETYEAGIRNAFERVEDTLKLAGASWSHVVEMTTFHVDMREHQDIFKTVREEFITDEPYPAWTGIGVEKLWADPLFVEIRVIAYLGD